MLRLLHKACCWHTRSSCYILRTTTRRAHAGLEASCFQPFLLPNAIFGNASQKRDATAGAPAETMSHRGHRQGTLCFFTLRFCVICFQHLVLFISFENTPQRRPLCPYYLAAFCIAIGKTALAKTPDTSIGSKPGAFIVVGKVDDRLTGSRALPDLSHHLRISGSDLGGLIGVERVGRWRCSWQRRCRHCRNPSGSRACHRATSWTDRAGDVVPTRRREGGRHGSEWGWSQEVRPGCAQSGVLHAAEEVVAFCCA